MKFINTLLLKLKVTDVIVIAFYFILSAISIIYADRINEWGSLLLINFIVVSFVLVTAYYDDKTKKKFWFYLHYWYVAPLILLTFKEIYLMVKPIRIEDFDHILIAADRLIFGTDPTVLLYKMANPFLTELLQIVYGSFYFLPIILGVNLMIKKRIIELDYTVFCIVYGFFLSYLGYFLLPAVGPRFTIHDFAKFDSDLPGLFFTPFLREIVNMGESIPTGTLNPISVVQRDVFPSGHTQMTLITMYLAYRFKVKSRYFLIPTGVLLIFATVYLRYHYFIDLVGGFIFMVFTLWSGQYIYNYWMRKTGGEEFHLTEIKVPAGNFVYYE